MSLCVVIYIYNVWLPAVCVCVSTFPSSECADVVFEVKVSMTSGFMLNKCLSSLLLMTTNFPHVLLKDLTSTRDLSVRARTHRLIQSHTVSFGFHTCFPYPAL